MTTEHDIDAAGIQPATDKEVERVRSEASRMLRSGRNDHICNFVTAGDLLALVARIDQLQQKLGTLPMTEDGVRITPMMEVWKATDPVQKGVVLKVDRHGAEVAWANSITWHASRGRPFYPNYIYSTEVAALAAAKETE